MTPAKIIRRLVEFTPSTLAPFIRPDVHGRCVAATRAGLDVLNRFGIDAEPLAVDVRAFNPAAVQWILDGSPGGPEEFTRRGCYMLTSDVPDGAPVLPPTRPNGGRGWGRHLVLRVPSRGLVLDLDMRQLARPEFGVDVPDAAAFTWGDAAGLVLDTPGGARIVYTPRDDRAYLDAPDWRHASPAIVDRLARLIRKGR